MRLLIQNARIIDPLKIWTRGETFCWKREG